MAITLTDRAVEEVKKVMEEQKMPLEENVLRVACQGGGCSGFMYSMSFEKANDGDVLNDTSMEFSGIKVKVDRRMEPYLDGTTIDFKTDLTKRGFSFENPLSKKNCGCGQSFGV
jgi:iron-sulfur cluster assembly protein